MTKQKELFEQLDGYIEHMIKDNQAAMARHRQYVKLITDTVSTIKSQGDLEITGPLWMLYPNENKSESLILSKPQYEIKKVLHSKKWLLSNVSTN